MTYGEDKKRDMIRSILPSKYRKSARDNIKGVKRRHRSKVNQALNEYRGAHASDAEEIYDDSAFDYESYPNHEIMEWVWERRLGDKDAPLVRWAAAQVQGMRQMDRLSYIRSILPDNTIGRHAADHCKWDDAFYIPDSGRWYNRISEEEREAIGIRRAERIAEDRSLAENLLRQVLSTNGAHKEFNSMLSGNMEYYMEFETRHEAEREIKGASPDYPRTDDGYWVVTKYPHYSRRHGAWLVRVARRRILEGAHDVEDFLDIARGWTVSTVTYKHRWVRDGNTMDDVLRSQLVYDPVEHCMAPAYKHSVYQGVIEAACRALHLRKETR